MQTRSLRNVLFICSIILSLSTSVSHALGGPFTLTDHNGKPFALEQIRGKVGILFFGFTHCPDVCPNTLIEIQRLMVALGEQSQQTQVLFISVDPERDTPEKLNTYVSYFNENFIGLTGSQEQLKAVSSRYNAGYKHIPDPSHPGGYAVEHTANIYLLDKAGNVASIILPRTPFAVLEQQVRKLVNEDPN